MADQWFYDHDDIRLGPCSAQQLKDLAAAGKIVPTDTIWKEGLDRGVVAAKVKNLFPAAPSAGPVSPAAEATLTPAETLVPSQRPGSPASKAQAVNHPSPSVLTADQGTAAEANPAEMLYVPAAPPKQPAKKGRAVAVKGAIIVNQDGSFAQYVKKCTKCGYQDTCRHRMPIRSGATRSNFYCPKCRKICPVEIQGSV